MPSGSRPRHRVELRLDEAPMAKLLRMADAEGMPVGWVAEVLIGLGLEAEKHERNAGLRRLKETRPNFPNLYRQPSTIRLPKPTEFN